MRQGCDVTERVIVPGISTLADETTTCVSKRQEAITKWSGVISYKDEGLTYLIISCLFSWYRNHQYLRVLYRYALHNDFTDKDGPHVRLWSHNITI